MNSNRRDKTMANNRIYGIGKNSVDFYVQIVTEVLISGKDVTTTSYGDSVTRSAEVAERISRTFKDKVAINSGWATVRKRGRLYGSCMTVYSLVVPLTELGPGKEVI
jgi:DNA-binding protein